MEKEILIERIRNLTSINTLIDLFNCFKQEWWMDGAYPITFRQVKYFTDYEKNYKYRTFGIPKKSGGERTIHSPQGNLEIIQNILHRIFQSIYCPAPNAYGFVKGKSIIDNAKCHVRKKFVFNIDISDFFGSITETMVLCRLRRPPFSFPEQIARCITKLCCFKRSYWNYDEETGACTRITKYVLPQGSPSSPILTNAVCDDMDNMLVGLANRFGLTYSRYADDITFSSNHNVYDANSDFRKELERIIQFNGFTINPKKTRLQHCSQRQEVTGLVVNDGVNVTSEWYKELRGVLHIWSKYGRGAAINAFYPRYRSKKVDLKREEPELENIVYGKLLFLRMVIGNMHPKYYMLLKQFKDVLSRQEKQPYTQRWNYIATMKVCDFEKAFKTKIDYCYSRRLTLIHHLGYPPRNEIISKEEEKMMSPRYYGLFMYGGKSFLVGISGNLNVSQMPYDSEISLCRTINTWGWRYFYMIHRHHTDYKPSKAKKDNAKEIEKGSSDFQRDACIMK